MLILSACILVVLILASVLYHVDKRFSWLVILCIALIACICVRFLAVNAAICTDATFQFIPEDPAPPEWPDILCTKLKQARCFHYVEEWGN